MIRFFKWVFRILKKNFRWKLISVGFAVLIWVFVIAQTNPTRIKTFEDIPVSFVGEEVLEQNGLCLTQNTSDIISFVDVSVEATVGQLEYLTKDNISASVDLSSITSTGNYSLSIKGKTVYGNVSSITPQSISVAIDEIETVELPIEVVLIGQQESYYYDTPQLDRKTVMVSGPKSAIQKYTKATCYMDVSGYTETVAENRNITIVDEDGNEVGSEKAQCDIDSVIVTVPIYPVKTIPIDTENVVSRISGVHQGYEITSVEMNLTSVDAAAPLEVLESVQSLTVKDIKLEDQTQTIMVNAQIDYPDSFEYISSEVVTLTINIEAVQATKTYESIPLAVVNRDSSYSYTLTPSSIDVTVTGIEEVIKQLKAEDIVPYVDVQGLKTGRHNVAVKFENAADINAQITTHIPVAEVVITKK